jgi:hypothetical protein
MPDNFDSIRDAQRLRIAPPTIINLLGIVNDVPESAVKEWKKEFPTMPSDPSAKEIREAAGKYDRAYQRAWKRDIERRMELWGPAAKAFVRGASDLAQMDVHYQDALVISDLLCAVAARNQRRDQESRDRKRGAHTSVANKLDGYEIFELPDPHALVRSIELVIDRQSTRAELRPTGLLRELLAEAELDRIKRCAYVKCGRFFWASRIDSPCCKESCRNAYKQKRHQERQNRQYRKFKTRNKANE